MPRTTELNARYLARRDDPDRLSAGTTAAWTSTALSAAVSVVVLGYWIFYGTDVLGLSPALLGTLALASKLLEAGAVIVAGWLVDRSPETRWGKARPYELAIVGVWASIWFLFSTPDLSDTGKAVWLFIGLIFVNVVFVSLLGANDVLYMARAFRTRQLFAKVSTRTGFFTVLGVVAVNVVLPIQVAAAGSSAPAWSMLAMFVAIPMTLLGLGRFFFVKEKYQTEAADAPKITFRDIRDVLATNRYLWIVSGITFLATLGGATGISVYYFRYIVGDIALMSVVALVPLIVLPSMLAFPWLMKRIGVSRVIMIGGAAGVTGGIVLLFADGNLGVVFVSTLLGGIAILPVTFLAQVLIIDNAAYNQWRGKRRLESTMGAINNFASRLGAGFAGAMTGWALGLAGYDGTEQTQPDAATITITVLAGALPAVLWLVVIVLMRSYRRFETMLPTITQELAVVLADDPSVDAPAAVPPARTDSTEQRPTSTRPNPSGSDD